MSIRRFAANYVFPVDEAPIKNGIVEVDEQGSILSVYAPSNPDALHSTEFHNGAIVPGFVNAHCHLELSHMHGRIAKGLGLTEFVRHIGQQRQAPAEQITQAIDNAIGQMHQTGTVAVADICNTPHTLQAKQQSDIAFATWWRYLAYMPTRRKMPTPTRFPPTKPLLRNSPTPP